MRVRRSEGIPAGDRERYDSLQPGPPPSIRLSESQGKCRFGDFQCNGSYIALAIDYADTISAYRISRYGLFPPSHELQRSICLSDVTAERGTVDRFTVMARSIVAGPALLVVAFVSAWRQGERVPVLKELWLRMSNTIIIYL